MENHDKSYESMDVDYSANSVTQMDISYNDSQVDTPHIKKEKLDEYADIEEPISASVNTEDIKSSETSKPMNTFHIIKTQPKMNKIRPQFKIISIVAVLAISVILYHLLKFDCSDELDLKQLEETLSKQVYGQNKAINSIINILNKEGTKLLFFYGSTGVGKTYTASLIMELLGKKSNLYHYTMPSFEEIFSTDFMYGLIVCKSSFFIVDGLSRNDKIVNQHVKDLIKKSQELDKKITIILIYSCDNSNNYMKKCDENFHIKVTEDFKDVNVNKAFVKFDLLNNLHLRQCIQKEARTQDIKIVDYEKLLKNFDVAVDGCKGVHTKIKLL